MPQAKSYMNSDDIIASVKRRIAFPVSQNTFSNDDILAFANEELLTSQVPSILQYHEEYYVYKVVKALESNINRYSIPDRAIGMRLSDLKWSDISGNYFDMTRVPASDKAFFQRSTGTNQQIHKFYIEGNEIVLTPEVVSGPSGSLNFFIFIRPNQLVDTARAAFIKSFNQTITLQSVANNDTVVINGLTYTAKTTPTPSTTEFQVGGTDAITATNLITAVNTYSTPDVTAVLSGTSSVALKFKNQSYTITGSSTFVIPSTTKQIEFTSLPSTYTNPTTNVTESLFTTGVKIDFLQSNPGHRIYTYDVEIPSNGISGNILTLTSSLIPASMIVGDYICLANECIIPYLPPDLHNVLAERTAARILASLGDEAGLNNSLNKLKEMDQFTGNLVDNRVESAPNKINARHSLLRYGKSSSRRRY